MIRKKNNPWVWFKDSQDINIAQLFTEHLSVKYWAKEFVYLILTTLWDGVSTIQYFFLMFFSKFKKSLKLRLNLVWYECVPQSACVGNLIFSVQKGWEVGSHKRWLGRPSGMDYYHFCESWLKEKKIWPSLALQFLSSLFLPFVMHGMTQHKGPHQILVLWRYAFWPPGL